MDTVQFHQVLFFPTDALDFYNCIMNSRIHSSFTGDEAVVEEKEGGAFSAFGGYIEGTNLTLERGKKIRQTWKAKEEGWPDDHYSEVVFLIKDIVGGCEVSFFHNDIPEDLLPFIEKGWNEFYWEPLKIYLNR